MQGQVSLHMEKYSPLPNSESAETSQIGSWEAKKVCNGKWWGNPNGHHCKTEIVPDYDENTPGNEEN